MGKRTMSRFKHIFGPVMSRRLGRSLGIDLVPRKTCNNNCVYCQVGATPQYTTERAEYVPTDEVIAEFEEWLALGEETDRVTFSGNGEPTLHSRIGEIIAEVKRLSPYPVAVITNGSTLADPRVRNELMTADLLVPTLEAAEQSLFERINRPAPGTLIIEIIIGLIAMRHVMKGEMWLEILLAEGLNDGDEALSMLAKAVQKIKPHRVQLHTLDRPPAEKSVRPVSAARLQEIAAEYFPGAEVVASRTEKANAVSGDLRAIALDTAARRPIRASDLAAATGNALDIAEKTLTLLERDGLLKRREDNGETFYSAE
ncbi:MAG: radical SAM protein [bacterium]|nr:radical SAM protein [bacterium]